MNCRSVAHIFKEVAFVPPCLALRDSLNDRSGIPRSLLLFRFYTVIMSWVENVLFWGQNVGPAAVEFPCNSLSVVISYKLTVKIVPA